LAKDQSEKELENTTDYQPVVGLLMDAAIVTWPDILYAVAALSHYNSWPFTSYMAGAKLVLQYLKSTADFGLHFIGNVIGIGIGIGNNLVGYSDSDLANASMDRKSQGGHGFLASNGAMPWQSRKQRLSAMSNLDTEFIACLKASRATQWLLQFRMDIHGTQKD
jgi:hypothetical protein